MANNKLLKLYKRVDKCRFCKAKHNRLHHIYGFGAIRPKLMLILINPTYKNLSSDQKYHGPRFPFIGVRQFWRVLADGGLVSKKTAYNLPLRKDWRKENTKEIQQELVKNKLFLTNIVKCCYNHAEYPEKKVIQGNFKNLAEEIKIVKPKRIIAFGDLVFQTLSRQLPYLNIPIVKCYFPIGRGKPKKAVKTLRKIKKGDYH